MAKNEKGRASNSWTHLVDVLVRARGTEAVQTELLVGVTLPAHGAHDLNGQRGDTVGQDAQAVLLGLSIEDLEAGQGDNTGLDVVVVGQVLDGVNADADLGTGRDQGDGGALVLVDNVATLDGVLDGRVLELGQVLAGQGQDAGGVLGGQSDVVSSARLVAVGRAPDHAVGQSTEVSQGLDRLVGRAVLTQTNGVVGGDPDNADLRQGRQTDGTGSVRDEVQESTTVGDQGAVGSQTVHDGTHTVLTDTVAEVTARVVAQASRRGLEVNGALPPGQVGASQIGRATNELRDGLLDLAEDNLRQLARGNGSVGGGVDGEVLLPALGQVTLQATGQVGVLSGVLLGVLGEQRVPLVLSGGTLSDLLSSQVVDGLGNGEALGGVEAELLLELLDVVSLEGRAVDTVGALLQGTETNDGAKLDQGGLVRDGLGLLDGGVDALKVVVAVSDDDDVPAVRLVALDNVLSEGAVGVAVNGDVVVVVDGNQVAELQVTGQRRGLARDTLHQAAITQEAVGVVVDQLEAVTVEGGGGVSLGNGQTDSVADTLAKRAGGDLNAGGVMGLGVAGGDAVDSL